MQESERSEGGRHIARTGAWAIPAAMIVAVEHLFALIIGAHVGFRYSIPFAAYVIAALTFVGLSGAAIIVVRLVVYARQHEEGPTRRLIKESRYFVGFALGVLLIALQMSVLMWTKIMLPIASPFWADPMLAAADHAIFGNDPWIIANDMFGWAAPFIDRAYISWAPVKFATLAFVLVMPESDTKTRSLLSDFVMVALVAVGQYLMSSAGPVFYQQFGFGARFQGLPMEPWVQAARDYLWLDYLKAGGDVGGGISAMPSLHVAAALWIALVWNAIDRRLGLIGFVYFALIAIGSVFLGWHYAVDGIAGSLIAIISWTVSPILARRFGGPKAAEPLGGARSLRNNPNSSAI